MAIGSIFNWYCLPGRLLAKWTYLFPKNHLQAIRSARHLDSKAYHFMGSTVLYIVGVATLLEPESKVSQQPSSAPTTLIAPAQPPTIDVEPAFEPPEADVLETPAAASTCVGGWIYVPSDWNDEIGISLNISADQSFEIRYSDYGQSQGRVEESSSEFQQLGDNGRIGQCTHKAAVLIHSNGEIYDMQRFDGDPYAEWQQSGSIQGE